MSDLRESHIQIRTFDFKDEDFKFNLTLRYDLNKDLCTQRMDHIKGLGIEPSNNVVVITHEFVNEQSAQETVEKLNSLKEMFASEPSSPPGAFANLCETISSKENKVYVTMRLPPESAEISNMLEPAAEALGDLVNKQQYLEFKISTKDNLKDIFTGQLGSPAAAALSGLCIKLELMLHKDLPQKLFEFGSNFVSGSEKEEVARIGVFASAFKHLKLDFLLNKPNEDLKELHKNEMLMGIMFGSQMLYGMAEQFGFMEVLNNGGSKTTAILCLSPMISMEFSLYAPTAIEALQATANP